jgi:hypothetical protein
MMQKRYVGVVRVVNRTGGVIEGRGPDSFGHAILFNKDSVEGGRELRCGQLRTDNGDQRQASCEERAGDEAFNRRAATRQT